MSDTYLFDAGWLFFAGWSVILVALGVVAFGNELVPSLAPKRIPEERR
jgi:hypothetical protein